MAGTQWPRPAVFDPKHYPADQRAAERFARNRTPDEPTRDPMAAPHVDASMPAFGGSIRLVSCSGGLEAVWIHVRDERGRQIALDPATCEFLPAAVRLTPADARTLSDLLRRYADTHQETDL